MQLVNALQMISPEIFLNAYRLMCTARAMAVKYEEQRQVCKYVHSTSRGHEAIQLATAFNLLPSILTRSIPLNPLA